ARVDLPKRHDWPAIIPAREQHVELVAAERPNLTRPQGSGLRMPRETKDIAMTVGVDFRLRTGAADEWIVRRNAAIVAQPQHLADVTAEILGTHSETPIVADDVSVAVADSYIHHAVGAELAAACNRTARFPGVGYENVAQIGECRAVEAPPREGQRGALLAFFLVRKIDKAVLH